MADVYVDERTKAMLETVAAAACELSIKWMITGAAGRVMLLEGIYGMPRGRATQDVDLGVMLASWEQYRALVGHLEQGAQFQSDPKQRQRLRFMGDGLLDLVPFGDIESGERSVAWPPENDFVMSVVGFREAYTDTIPVPLGGLDVPVVSPVGLALLKLVAWHERHHGQPKKDAADLAYVLRHFRAILTEETLFNEHFPEVEAAGYDVDLAACRVLGQKMARLTEPDTGTFVRKVLEEQLQQGTDSTLVREVAEHSGGADAERAFELLRSLTTGFTGVAK